MTKLVPKISAVRKNSKDSLGHAFSKLSSQFSFRYDTFEPNSHWSVAYRVVDPVKRLAGGISCQGLP